MKIRLDKYVWCVRLSKTRSQASEVISKGKIQLNGLAVKPSREVKMNDVISIQRHNAALSFRVIQLLDRRTSPPLVKEYIIDETPEEEYTKLKQYQLAQKMYRETDGKPTKKDRRDLDRFLDNWEE